MVHLRVGELIQFPLPGGQFLGFVTCLVKPDDMAKGKAALVGRHFRSGDRELVGTGEEKSLGVEIIFVCNPNGAEPVRSLSSQLGFYREMLPEAGQRLLQE